MPHVSLFPDLSRRVVEPEMMDAPDLDRPLHTEALDALARLNRASRSVSILWRGIVPLMAGMGKTPLRVLDVATGAGDVPAGLWLIARRRGMELKIDACDRSAVAIDHARRRARRCDAKVRFFQCNAVNDTIATSYDVVMCSLFLHHLSDSDGLQLLQRMAMSAQRLVMVNDLERSRCGLALACAASRVLTRSRVVWVDAVRSVRAAFTRDEVRALAARAGLASAVVGWRWPWRFLLMWSRT